MGLALSGVSLSAPEPGAGAPPINHDSDGKGPNLARGTCGRPGGDRLAALGPHCSSAQPELLALWQHGDRVTQVYLAASLPVSLRPPRSASGGLPLGECQCPSAAY